MSTFGDFKQLERNMGLSDSANPTDSFSFTDSVTSVFDGLETITTKAGNTFLDYVKLQQQYKDIKNSKDDAIIRNYEDEQQSVATKQGSSNPNLIYYGIGAVALYLVFGGN